MNKFNKILLQLILSSTFLVKGSALNGYEWGKEYQRAIAVFNGLLQENGWRPIKPKRLESILDFNKQSIREGLFIEMVDTICDTLREMAPEAPDVTLELDIHMIEALTRTSFGRSSFDLLILRLETVQGKMFAARLINGLPIYNIRAQHQSRFTPPSRQLPLEQAIQRSEREMDALSRFVSGGNGYREPTHAENFGYSRLTSTTSQPSLHQFKRDIYNARQNIQEFLATVFSTLFFASLKTRFEDLQTEFNERIRTLDRQIIDIKVLEEKFETLNSYLVACFPMIVLQLEDGLIGWNEAHRLRRLISDIEGMQTRGADCELDFRYMRNRMEDFIRLVRPIISELPEQEPESEPL
jgi:hypothetical protein